MAAVNEGKVGTGAGFSSPTTIKKAQAARALTTAKLNGLPGNSQHAYKTIGRTIATLRLAQERILSGKTIEAEAIQGCSMLEANMAGMLYG